MMTAGPVGVATRSRCPRPGKSVNSASASPASARSPPAASTAASTARALPTQWRPAMPTLKVSRWLPTRAVTHEQSGCSATCSATTSAPSPVPKVTIFAACGRAWPSKRSRCGLSNGMIAVPPGCKPAKISPLASAMPASSAKFSICAEATHVITAIAGRTCCVNAAISPAWFMPISKMPKRLSAGIRARLSGTPVWLL